MAAGDITAVRIASAAAHNGFVAEIDIEGLSALGSGAFALGLGANNDPATAKIVFTVTSPGFDATGAATTIQRTVYGTQWVRKAYPDHASVDEAAAAGTLTTRVALSESIHPGDTATVTIAAGFYTGSNAVTNLAVTNNSTLAYPKVIGKWAKAPFEAVQANFVLEAVCFQKFGKDGKPVACVIFEVTDGTTTQTATVTAMTVSTIVGVGLAATNKVLVYAATIPISGFIQGAVLTCNFTAYPWVGEAAAVLDSDTGITPPDERLCPHLLLCDKNATYGGGHAVVDATNGRADATDVAVYATKALADAAYLSVNTNSYNTIGRAAAAIKAWNNTNLSRNEPGGGVIYLTGSHIWPGTTNAATLGAQNTWLTITRYTGSVPVARADAQISSGTGARVHAQRVRLYDISLPGSSTNQILGGSNATDALWIDDCDINNTSASLLAQWKASYHTRNAITAMTQGFVPVATKLGPALVRGNAGPTTAAGTGIRAALYCVLGNYNIRPYSVQTGNNAGSETTSDNAIWAFNTSYGINASYSAIGIGPGATHGLAFVQNVIEKINGTTDLLSTANEVRDENHYLFWHNTLVGQRWNVAYNEVGSTPYYRTNFSQRNNVVDEWNNKDDTFVTPAPDGLRVGAWPVGYNVGSAGNHKRAASSAEWKGEFFGLYNIDGGTLGFVDDASFNNGGGGDASANGDYHLTASASGYALVPAGYAVLPYDLEGTARNNSGGGSAGAYEMNAPAGGGGSGDWTPVHQYHVLFP